MNRVSTSVAQWWWLVPGMAVFFGMTQEVGAAAVDQHDGVTITASQIATSIDSVPRFCTASSVESTASGRWSSAGTWSTGSTPGTDARVRIRSGTDVTYDLVSDTELYCIEVDQGATLRFATNRDTRLRVVHMTVLPTGSLIVGDSERPIARDATAEIVIPDRALEVTGQDPRQFGNGLIVFGTLTMHGRVLPQTFVRLTEEPRFGDRFLQLREEPVGWLPGDTLVLPETRQIPFRKGANITSRTELPVVASVSGAQVALVAPLEYDHRGPRDMDGNVGPLELDMRPHLGNLTRNVIVRSEGISESAKFAYCEAPDHIDQPHTCITRGHTILMRRSDVDIRYVSFENLGRTDTGDLSLTTVNQGGVVTAVGQNQVARYPVHTHHLIGPANPSDTGHQFQLIGNVVRGFLKWAIVIHGSHYGLIQGNIAYDGKASAIVTEDGSESFNVFERNFVVHQGAGQPIDVLETSGRAGVEDAHDDLDFNGRSNFGFERDCFWFSTPNNYVRDNVATNCTFGYNYNGYYTSLIRKVPKFRGADMVTDSMDTRGLPALESARNEAYGAIGQGLWIGWSRGCCRVNVYEDESVFEHFRIWHVSHSAVESYHESANTFDGFVLRNDPAVSAMSQGGSARYTRGFNLGNPSYENGRTVVVNADIQGFNVGVGTPRNPTDGTAQRDIFRLEGTRLRNHVNIEHRPSRTTSEGHTFVRNVEFESLLLPGVSGQPRTSRNVWMNFALDRRTNIALPSRFFLDNSLTTGTRHELFFLEQGPDAPSPGDSMFGDPRFSGCPEDGLTNRECHRKHGVAALGTIAPCIAHDNDSSCRAAIARAAAMGIEGMAFPLPTSTP